MEPLPPPEEREWLHAELAALSAHGLAEALLSAPIVEPSDRCFPDPWKPTAGGVRTLVRRLLAYARLDLRVSIEVVSTVEQEEVPTAAGDGRRWVRRGSPVVFAGILEGTLCLRVDPGALADPEGLTGNLARAVATAYRVHRRLAGADEELEARRTDITAVCLGFGVLGANVAYRYRAGMVDGGLHASQWAHDRSGALSPEAMSYLLATQAVARRLDAGARRELTRVLEPNQAACFRAACESLDES